MNPLTDVVVPVVVFFAMMVIGLDLTVEDFRRVAREPRLVLFGAVGQVVLLPPLAAGLARLLALPPALAGGLMLVAVCPTAALANLYTSVARASVALSVTVTGLSCVVSVATLPLAGALGLAVLLGGAAGVHMPVARTAGQLVLLLLVPIAVGMLLSSWRPGLAERHGGRLRVLGLAVVLVIGIVIVSGQAALFARTLGTMAAAAGVFSLAAMGAGWAVGWLARRPSADRFALAMDFSSRNLAIAIAVAVTILGRSEFVVFAAAFFAIQAALATAAIALYRRKA